MSRVPTLPCPEAPLRHGELLDVPQGSGRLRCIHQDHDGRPKSHPLGAASATRSAFRLDEVEAARKAIAGGRAEAAREA